MKANKLHTSRTKKETQDSVGSKEYYNFVDAAEKEGFTELAEKLRKMASVI